VVDGTPSGALIETTIIKVVNAEMPARAFVVYHARRLPDLRSAMSPGSGPS